MESEKANLVSGDLALTDPKHDRLGYPPFAKHLAESICKMLPPEGMVIAVYGSWGLGKTTVLNFVQHYLKKKPEPERPEIIQFNPWWFSGREDLVRDFFGQLVLLFEKHRVMAHAVREKLADLADFISAVPVVPYAQALGPLAKLLRPKQKDVSELKKHIADALRKQEKRILVVIDDIDRLTAEEIRQLFRAIKAVADFPNVLYLLAFDKKVAVKALQSEQEGFGESYLEKIVQVPFELPLPDKLSLRRLLLDKLNVILADAPVDAREPFFEQTRWQNLYLKGIEPFLRTPRDVVRFANTLSVTYPAVRREVDPADFVAIEALRVFCPRAYDEVRNNPSRFVGLSIEERLLDSKGARLKGLHEKWLREIEEEQQETVKRLLSYIFPKFAAHMRESKYDTRREKEWRKQVRICSSSRIFPVYFRLGIPEGGIRDADMRAMLAVACNRQLFTNKLVELSRAMCPGGHTRIYEFLDRMLDYMDGEIPSEHITCIIQSFFDVGDQLSILDAPHMRRVYYSVDVNMLMQRVVWRLLWRVNEQERFDVLSKAMCEGKAILATTYATTSLYREHGKYGGDQPEPPQNRLVNEEHIESLVRIATDKIREAAKSSKLSELQDRRFVLRAWLDWAGVEEPRAWVLELTETDEGLIGYIEEHLVKTESSLADETVKGWYRLDPKWLEPFLHPDEIIGRVKELAKGTDLTKRQEIALQQFIEEYKIRKRGEDPASVLHLENI